MQEVELQILILRFLRPAAAAAALAGLVAILAQVVALAPLPLRPAVVVAAVQAGRANTIKEPALPRSERQVEDLAAMEVVAAPAAILRLPLPLVVTAASELTVLVVVAVAVALCLVEVLRVEPTVHLVRFSAIVLRLILAGAAAVILAAISLVSLFRAV